MAFGKKDHIVGLDIGSRSIKAAEITETKRGLSLTHFGIVDIAHGAIEKARLTTLRPSQNLLNSYLNRIILKKATWPCQ